MAGKQFETNTEIKINPATGAALMEVTGSNVVNGGQVKTTIYSSGGSEAAISSGFGNSDTLSGSAYPLIGVSSFDIAYNGATWDRWRNNTQGTLLASAARTATAYSPTQTNYNAKGVIVFLDVSVASGTGGLQVGIRTTDPQNSDTYLLHVLPAAVTGVTRSIYLLYPGATSTGGSIVSSFSAPLPRNWYVQVTHGDATSYTYSLSYALII